jgi:hypothetical protein
MADKIKITAPASELMAQASSTVWIYYRDFEERLDNAYGEGRTKKNSETAAILARAAAIDLQTAMISYQLQEIREKMGD